MTSCDLGTCSLCAPISRRGIVEPISLTSIYNQSVEHHGIDPTIGKLEKRIFRLDGTGTQYLNPAKPKGYTHKAVANYLVQQIVGVETSDGKGEEPVDNQYGDLKGFFAGDERAVSHQAEFGTEAFQFGTSGLHGCTMVAVISRRGVWMAHLWESYSNSRPNTDSFPDEVFQERVIDFLTGTPVTNPTNSPASVNFAAMTDEEKVVYEGIWKNYVPPSGDLIDPTLFNRPMTDGFNKNEPITEENYPGDNTKIYIMAPAADNVVRKSDAGTLAPQKNPKRVQAIV